MTVTLRVLPAAEWPMAVAEMVGERVRQRPQLRLVLPTGDTPSPMYAALAQAVRDGRVSLAQATVILLDEYVGLPPGDAARCDARLRRELIDQVDGPAAFHPIRVDDLAPDNAAATHDAVAADGVDLALLGLGSNGHVGLNEPGSTETSRTRVVSLAGSSRQAAVERYGAAVMPEAGITLGLDRLLQADEVWLLVTGGAKAEVLRRTLEEAPDAGCPATFLRRHPRLVVLADEPAAARLAGQ